MEFLLMSRTLEKHPLLPIIIRTFKADFDFAAEIYDTVKEDQKMLDEQPEMVFYLLDMLHLHLTLDDAITGIRLGTTQYQRLQHPRVRETLIVTENRLIIMAVHGLSASAFGSIQLHLFKTIADALAHVQAKV
ncbi:MAG: hypothetical protein SGI73_06870 [Chloroflexota bacterium]|nr:hypothetical protein [Chloroflexota bacterium]